MKKKFCSINKHYLYIIFILCLIINFFGKWVAQSLLLPFWFDCIGTFLMACAFGPIAGGVTGFISTLITTILFSTNIHFALTGISTGVIVGLFFSKETRDYFQLLCTAAITSITSITISTPLTLICCHGTIENIWGDALYTMLLQAGNSELFSFILGIAFVEFPDKVLSLFIAAILFRLLGHFQQFHVRKENVQ